MTTKPRTLHEKIEQFARDLIWGRADHECGGLHAGVCRQCDEDVQHLTRKLETLFAALLEAVPRLDVHDPLCSEGQYRGDQVMDCDCASLLPVDPSASPTNTEPLPTTEERVDAAPEDGGRLLLNAYGRACYRAGEYSMLRRLESRRKELGICNDVAISSRICEFGSSCCTVHHLDVGSVSVVEGEASGRNGAGAQAPKENSHFTPPTPPRDETETP